MNKFIYPSSTFKRHFKKRIARNKDLSKLYEQAAARFMRDPQDRLLRIHALKGAMKGCYAFSLDSNYRVIFYEAEDAYIFVDIGTHDQVYHKG